MEFKYNAKPHLSSYIYITPYNIDKIDEIVNILKIIISKKVEDKDDGFNIWYVRKNTR